MEKSYCGSYLTMDICDQNPLLQELGAVRCCQATDTHAGRTGKVMASKHEWQTRTMWFRVL